MIIPDEEDFPALPISAEGTPCKEPALKKALLATPQGEGRSSSAGGNNDVIDVLSSLINIRFDAMEKLINDNSLKIEGLKKSVDFAFEERKDVKTRMDVAQSI